MADECQRRISPARRIQIQELLPQEEHRPQQTGVLPVNPSSVVYPAVVYIRDHLQQEITMKEMADLCHLSPSYFPGPLIRKRERAL